MPIPVELQNRWWHSARDLRLAFTQKTTAVASSAYEDDNEHFSCELPTYAGEWAGSLSHDGGATVTDGMSTVETIGAINMSFHTSGICKTDSKKARSIPVAATWTEQYSGASIRIMPNMSLSGAGGSELMIVPSPQSTAAEATAKLDQLSRRDLAILFAPPDWRMPAVPFFELPTPHIVPQGTSLAPWEVEIQTGHDLKGATEGLDGRTDLSATLSAVPGHMRELTVWARAFIPGALIGMTTPVPGASGGASMTTTFPKAAGCFATDDRGFSESPGASARIKAGVRVDLQRGELVPIIWPDGRRATVCDESIEYDCDTGSILSRKTATPRGGFSDLTVSSDGNTWKWKCIFGGNNPLVRGSTEINVDLAFTLTLDTSPDAGTLEISGEVNDFPAYEAYCSVDGGPITSLFTSPVVATIVGPVTGLLSSHNVSGSIHVKSPTK